PFVGERLAEELLREFLDRRSYDRDFAGRLVAVAAARGCAPSWPVRRLAVLMLEAQLLALPAGHPGEWGRGLRATPADPAGGPGSCAPSPRTGRAAWSSRRADRCSTRGTARPRGPGSRPSSARGWPATKGSIAASAAPSGTPTRSSTSSISPARSAS